MCDCRSCQRSRRLEEITSKLSPEEAVLIEELQIDLAHAQEDAVYYEMKYKDTWLSVPMKFKLYLVKTKENLREIQSSLFQE